MSFSTQLNLFLNLVLMVCFHHAPIFNIKTENEEGWAFIWLCAFVPVRHPRRATALILLVVSSQDTRDESPACLLLALTFLCNYNHLFLINISKGPVAAVFGLTSLEFNPMQCKHFPIWPHAMAFWRTGLVLHVAPGLLGARRVPGTQELLSMGFLSEQIPL